MRSCILSSSNTLVDNGIKEDHESTGNDGQQDRSMFGKRNKNRILEIHERFFWRILGGFGDFSEVIGIVFSRRLFMEILKLLNQRECTTAITTLTPTNDVEARKGRSFREDSWQFRMQKQSFDKHPVYGGHGGVQFGSNNQLANPRLCSLIFFINFVGQYTHENRQENRRK